MSSSNEVLIDVNKDDNTSNKISEIEISEVIDLQEKYNSEIFKDKNPLIIDKNPLITDKNSIITELEILKPDPPKPEPPKSDPPKPEPETLNHKHHEHHEHHNEEHIFLKKLTFSDAYDMINKASNDKVSKSSTSLDILAIYMKGQKTLYTESKTYCEKKLNSLMLPAIFISSLCVVLGATLDSTNWGKTLVASFNAFNVFLLAIISYLKLDAKAEAHKTSAYKYDKLQSQCEFLSGRTLFYSENPKDAADENAKKDSIKNMINDIESKVTEVKESNQFILPEYIRYKYPVLFSTNVFAEVKKLQHEELVKINEFKEIVNESINFKNMRNKNEEIILKLSKLEIKINEKLKEIILHKNKFLDLDSKFGDEIDTAIKQSKENWCNGSFFST